MKLSKLSTATLALALSLLVIDAISAFGLIFHRNTLNQEQVNLINAIAPYVAILFFTVVIFGAFSLYRGIKVKNNKEIIAGGFALFLTLGPIVYIGIFGLFGLFG